uniref:Uncharacterized protein n=1 Tax=Anopheles maculatus TaxID=74869 RepID=A0A182TA72_9DIPT
MTRMLCVDTPYLETELIKCRLTLRRHQLPLMHVVIRVPKVYNYIVIQYNLHYKFTTFQPFLINGEFEGCVTLMKSTRGTLQDPLSIYMLKNRTYEATTVFRKEYMPQSIPAGDYRMDLRFATKSNVTMLSVQLYFSARRKGVLGSMLEW